MAKSQDYSFLPPPRILTSGGFSISVFLAFFAVAFFAVFFCVSSVLADYDAGTADLTAAWSIDRSTGITLDKNDKVYNHTGTITIGSSDPTIKLTNGAVFEQSGSVTPNGKAIVVSGNGTFNISGSSGHDPESNNPDRLVLYGFNFGSGNPTIDTTPNSDNLLTGHNYLMLTGTSGYGILRFHSDGGFIIGRNTFPSTSQSSTDIHIYENANAKISQSSSTLVSSKCGLNLVDKTVNFIVDEGGTLESSAQIFDEPEKYGDNTGSLIKSGSGTITITNSNNTYVKPTSITEGKLVLSGAGNLTGTKSITIASGATLEFKDNDADGEGGAVTFTRNISGAGNLVKSGTGTVVLSGSNTYSGNVAISGGKLSASNASSLGSNSTGRTVTVGTGAELVFTVNNVITNAHNDQNVSYVLDGGRISNSGSVYNYLQNLTVKNGATIYASNGLSDWKAFKLHNVNVVRNSDDSAGSAVVFSASSNANATIAFGAKSSTIQAGTSVSTINVAEITSVNATVNDNVSDLVISAVIADPVYESNGTLKNATKIVKTGAGTLELSGANTFTGPVVVENGTLLVSNSAGLGANTAGKTITVGSDGEIVLAVNNVFSDAHNDQNVTYILDGGRISNLGAVYNYLQNLTLKDGASVYASDGHSPWNAYKFFNVSVERNSDGTAGAPVVFSANMEKEHATFAFGAKSSEAGTKTAVIYVEDITSSNAAVVDNVSDLVISGIIANTLTNYTGTTAAAPIEKTGAGTLEFTAANTYTGITTISAGTLKLTGDAIESVAGNITVNAGGTLEYNVAQNDERTATFTNAAYVLGNGDILKTGEGRLKINTDELDQAASDLHFTADNFVVASGRLDLEGYMLGNIEVDANTVFSPGNSIGEATFGGGYILKDGATLLLEVGKDGDDVLTDVLNVTGDTTFEDRSIIKIALDSSYDNNFVEGDQADIQLPSGILGSDGNDLNLDNLVLQLGMFELVGYDSGTGILSVRLSAPAAGVPEPSTWALLILGAAGLLYVRKQTRK